jgi:hypothetical protein
VRGCGGSCGGAYGCEARCGCTCGCRADVRPVQPAVPLRLTEDEHGAVAGASAALAAAPPDAAAAAAAPPWLGPSVPAAPPGPPPPPPAGPAGRPGQATCQTTGLSAAHVTTTFMVHVTCATALIQAKACVASLFRLCAYFSMIARVFKTAIAPQARRWWRACSTRHQSCRQPPSPSPPLPPLYLARQRKRQVCHPRFSTSYYDSSAFLILRPESLPSQWIIEGF